MQINKVGSRQKQFLEESALVALSLIVSTVHMRTYFKLLH